jgi:hypothetical protein
MIHPDETSNPFNEQVGGDHYKTNGMNITEFVMSSNIPYAEGLVMKYVYRHGKKNGIEDLRKAQHYLRFIAWVKYNEVL